MQIALDIRRQALEPGRWGAGGECGLEARGEGRVVQDLGEEAGGGGGFEHGEDGWGGEFGGEVAGDGAEGEEDCGIGGEGGDAGERGAGGGKLVVG